MERQGGRLEIEEFFGRKKVVAKGEEHVGSEWKKEHDESVVMLVGHNRPSRHQQSLWHNSTLN